MFLGNTDIWGEILVRVPAESLIRARAVSKGFRAVIDDPCFVRAHTNKHQQQLSSSSKIIIQKSTRNAAVNSCYSLDLETLISFSNGHQSIPATPLDLDFISNKLSTPVAECNGLYLTENFLTIWNPLTHERLELPPSPDFSRKLYNEQAFGLGYDYATDDYKAVVILKETRDTHVYSLKSDSWRRIMNCPPCVGPDGTGVFVCGALNWLSRECGDYDDKILALDLGTEKYSLLQMPRVWNKFESPNMLYKMVLDGCLAVCEGGFCSYSDVWVMKVYGDEGSWIKLFSLGQREWNISLWTCFLWPVIMKERIVLLQDATNRFLQFDVETKSFKWVIIDCSFFGEDTFSYAKKMFVGTIFRLHANCGGGVRKIAATSCFLKKKKVLSADAVLFCIRDANDDAQHHDSCSITRENLSSENEEDGSKLEAICSNNSSSNYSPVDTS